jgi:tRNA(Ile)-lysidine synthase
MNRSAEKISQAYDFIREYAEIKYRELSVCVPGGQTHVVLRASGLCALHPAIRQEVLRMALFEAAGHRKDIASVHVEELDGLLRMQSGRRIALPYGLTAFLEYDTLHVCRACPACTELPGQQTSLVTVDALRALAGDRDTGTDEPQCGDGEQTPRTKSANTRSGEEEPWVTAREDAPWVLLWEDGTGAGLRARVWKTMSPLEEITKKAYTKQFDYDKINSGFLVRKRQKGDYFVLDQDGHRKKLSDYMINEKIPARLRDRIPLLAKGSEVIWLVGGRISATGKVTKDTTRIMEIEYYGGMSDGLS